jgi:hypothetical protein
VLRSLTKLAVRPVRRARARFERYIRGVRLRVYIAHDAVAVCRTEGRFRPKLQKQAVITLPSTSRDPARGISEALQLLPAWLQEQPHQGTVEWIVGFEHVRYLTLPWDERLCSKSFCRTLAKAMFSQQFDENHTSFSSAAVRFAPVSYGRPRLAALIPDHVIQTLVSFSHSYGWRTTKITPALALVWDSFFNRFKMAKGELALVEGQRLQRVAYEFGNIVALKARPFSDTDTPSSHHETDFVFPPGDAPGLSGEALQVKGMATGDDVRMAYALCGVL